MVCSVLVMFFTTYHIVLYRISCTIYTVYHIYYIYTYIYIVFRARILMVLRGLLGPNAWVSCNAGGSECLKYLTWRLLGLSTYLDPKGM